MVVLHVNMFCLWIHIRSPSQFQSPTVIIEQFTQDSWLICANVIYQGLHLFEDLGDRNGLAQLLDECNLLTLSRAEGYIPKTIQQISSDSVRYLNHL